MQISSGLPHRSIRTLVVCLGIGTAVLLQSGPAPAASEFQTPSVIFDEGTKRGIPWETGARKSRGLGRGRPCFWIRVRAKGDIEVPAEWCGSPRGYPHFAATTPKGGSRFTVELVVAPLEVTDVRLIYRKAPARNVSLSSPPRNAESVGLKSNFRFTTRVFDGKPRFRKAIYYDADGNVVNEFPPSDHG